MQIIIIIYIKTFWLENIVKIYWILLSGGSFHVARKHSEPAKINYRSGFFITTNVMPNFGHESDQNAILKRLHVFKTATLPRKDSSVTGKEEILVNEIFHYILNN